MQTIHTFTLQYTINECAVVLLSGDHCEHIQKVVFQEGFSWEECIYSSSSQKYGSGMMGGLTLKQLVLCNTHTRLKNAGLERGVVCQEGSLWKNC